MATMALSATGSLLSVTTAIHLTSTQVEYDACQFTFDSAWAGYAKTAVFYADVTNVVEVVLVADACDIPWDAFSENKRYLYIGVYGTDGTSVLPTNFVEVAVAPGSNIGGAPSTPPTASVYLQLLAAYGVVASDIDELESAVAVAQSDIDALETSVTALASGSPAGTYADLAALIAANPDHSKIYITLDDGNWCYHNGSAWVAGGVYQAAEIQDGDITPEKLSQTAQIGSKNLYPRWLVLDGYLVSNAPSNPLSVYADSILSGYVPVEEGKKYTVTNGPYQYLRSLHFYGPSNTAICAQTHTGGYYGAYPGGNYWPSCTGKVNIAWKEKDSAVFEVLPGSGITHVLWYITKTKTSNYYGPHDGLLQSITANVQINEGDALYDWDLYTPKSTKISKAIIEDADGTGVLFTRAGDVLQIRSAFDKMNDMAIRWGVGDSGNKHLNMTEMMLVGKTTAPDDVSGGYPWKSCNDDIAPLQFNGSYIGANHGYNAAWTVTSTGHSMTSANIGELWTDGAGLKYAILSIVDANRIFVCSEYTGNELNPLSSSPPSTSLTRPDGNVTRTIGGVSAVEQLRPAINHKTWRVEVDGKVVDYGVDTVERGEYVDIIETYDIIHIPNMLSYLAANVPGNTNSSYYSDEIAQKYCTVSNVYRHTREGAMTIYTSIDFFKDVNFNHAGLVQSSTIGHYTLVPKTSFDTVSLQSSTQTFEKATWDNTGHSPNRYYQFATSEADKGIAIGYCPEVGLGDETDRVPLMYSAGLYHYSSYKMYPYLINGETAANTAKSISAVAYRVPLYKRDHSLTALCWYWVGDDIYINIEAHSAVDKMIVLPDYMKGRKVSIVESNGITFPQGVVGSSGLRVIVASAGSAVVKLSK